MYTVQLFVHDCKQELVKTDRGYPSKNLFSFHLNRFLSRSLYLSLSRFPYNKYKLSTITSETWNYVIHTNRH